MKTKAQHKAEKRQSLLSNEIDGAVNFELIRLNDVINGEVVISKNIGKRQTGVTLSNPLTGRTRVIEAQQTIIENQPITYIVL